MLLLHLGSEGWAGPGLQQQGRGVRLVRPGRQHQRRHAARLALRLLRLRIEVVLSAVTLPATRVKY